MGMRPSLAELSGQSDRISSEIGVRVFETDRDQMGRGPPAARWGVSPFRALSRQSFSIVHCSGCWFWRARSITWVTLVSATS